MSVEGTSRADTRLRTKTIVACVIFVALCLLASSYQGDQGVWFSIVPPLVAILLAMTTGRILLSLGSAILIGGLLTAFHTPDKASLAGAGNAVGFVWSSVTDPFNLMVLAFIVPTMMMVCLMVAAGGFRGIVNWLARFSAGRRSAQILTALSGLILFIDDYVNTMIVGSTLRPLTDKARISREKLSFLVDATSAPVAGLAFVSTWVGYEVGLFAKAAEALKINQDGYTMFFDALPFRFYCILMIMFVLVNVLTGRDYGPMARAEKRARLKGALMEDEARPLTSKGFSAASTDALARPNVASAIAPIMILLFFLFSGFWVDGGGMKLLAESPFAFLNPINWKTVITGSENSVNILALAAFAGCLSAVYCAKAIGGLGFQNIRSALWLGLRSSSLPIAILVCAWSLKGACDALGTGPFLSAVVGGVVSPYWFPAILFLVSGLTAFATGTSWGTMAILIPTAVPIAFGLDGSTYGLVTMMSLGAVLDGAIFGDHCSPISDTTIMSSISSACDHTHHVRTQLPYAMSVATVALLVGYLPTGFGLPTWIAYLGAATVFLGIFLAFGWRAPDFAFGDTKEETEGVLEPV